MKKYKYGPLVYITVGMDEEEGNYFWNGSPPVDYDVDGIPVDKDGRQCLDISCPLHPSHEAEITEYSEALTSDIPTLDSFREWFDNNFLLVTDDQLKRWIIRWWARYTRRTNSELYFSITKQYSSVEEIQEAVWPQDEQTS